MDQACPGSSSSRRSTVYNAGFNMGGVMNNVPLLDHYSGSWVIVNKSTGAAVFETFNKSTAEKINFKKYQVLTAYQYLTGLNK